MKNITEIIINEIEENMCNLNVRPCLTLASKEILIDYILKCLTDDVDVFNHKILCAKSFFIFYTAGYEEDMVYIYSNLLNSRLDKKVEVSEINDYIQEKGYKLNSFLLDCSNRSEPKKRFSIKAILLNSLLTLILIM